MTLLSIIVKNASALAKGGDNRLQDSLWRIYYHFSLTAEDLVLVQQYAKELQKASETMDVWITSSFGKVFKFLSDSTLTELRNIWASYARERTLNDDKQVRQAIKSLDANDSQDSCTLRRGHVDHLSTC